MKASCAAAYGMYPDNVVLPEVVSALNRAGFGKEDICVVFSPGHPVAAIVRDTNKMSNTNRDSAALGILGWVSQFGAVVIPSVGLFIRSQAFFQALMGQTLSAVGAGLRTLVDLGFSENEAKRLNHHLAAGAMVYISCAERAKADWATELMRRTGACEAAALEHVKAAGVAA